MRCFRIDEDVHTGIHLEKMYNDNLAIEVGDSIVPLDEAFSAVLTNKKQDVVNKIKDCLYGDELDGSPLTREESSRLSAILAYVEPESIQLIYADVGSGNDIVREKGRSPDALVLVETAAGPNGGISFLSNTYDEVVDPRSKRVKRRYHSSFPPPGVTVIKEGKTPQGSKCYLLRMVPNASIRIERTGVLEGAPSVLTLVWKGRRGREGSPPLLMFSPDRRQEP